jgi:hypothetical protein
MAAPYLVNGMSGVLAAPIFVSGPNKLFDYAIFNAASATSFVSVYDSVLAPTVGTTVPKYQVGVSTLRSVHLAVQDVAGIYFKDGVWVAATTTAAGSSAPDTPVVVSLGMSTAAAPPSEAYALQILADGASNYWRLGEISGTVAVDKIGGANGTISGGVTLAQPGALADGDKAMAFDGATGNKIKTTSVTIPAASTVEIFLNLTNTSSQRTYLAMRPEINLQLAWLLSSGNTGVIQVYTGTFVTSTKTITVGDGWHHVVIVFLGSTTLIYVDGVLDSTTAQTHSLGTAPLRIGYDEADIASPIAWAGTLDEVAIYPVALTAAQIANHYALRTVS